MPGYSALRENAQHDVLVPEASDGTRQLGSIPIRVATSAQLQSRLLPRTPEPERYSVCELQGVSELFEKRCLYCETVCSFRFHDNHLFERKHNVRCTETVAKLTLE